MGFTKAPNTLYDTLLFINNVHDHPWSYDKDHPCQEKALEGRIIGLYVKEAKEYKGEKALKLHILIKDDDEKVFCLRAGIKTVFVRGFLQKAQKHFESRNVNLPVIISPTFSERDKNIIFCQMWAENVPVKINWDKEFDAYDLACYLAERYLPLVPFDQRFSHVELENEVKIDPVHDFDGEAEPYQPKSSQKIDRNFYMTEIEKAMKSVGWTVKQGREYLQANYGVQGRSFLSDKDLVEFFEYLQKLKQETQLKNELPF